MSKIDHYMKILPGTFSIQKLLPWTYRVYHWIGRGLWYMGKLFRSWLNCQIYENIQKHWRFSSKGPLVKNLSLARQCRRITLWAPTIEVYMLYESSRRKPGWRFTAGVKSSLFLNIFVNLTIRFRIWIVSGVETIQWFRFTNYDVWASPVR